MAVVYDAEDLRLGRFVAIKLVRNVPSDIETERLFREAKAAARTNHPAVVTIFGYGTDSETDVDYLVMERLEGEDLSSRIVRLGPLPCELALRIGIEVADALAAVHAIGVIHRDLKPANIFLARRGLRLDEVKVLDFGIAKHLDLHTITSPNQLVGTLPYMAPEQLLDLKQASPLTDIYSLGVTLFECLAGVLPFQAKEPVDLVRQLMHSAAPSLRDLRPEVSESCATIVARCLHSDPGERYPSARALCTALQSVGNA
jgi:serine/threonine protein kinase